MKTHNAPIRTLILLAALAATIQCADAESRSERKAREAAESAKPVNIQGGQKFTVELPYSDAFPAIVRTLQKADYTIESASKDAGTVVTELVVTGSYHQTGTRSQITVIDEGSGKTTIKVTVTTQKRYKALQTEPWSSPELDTAQSEKLAALLRTGITPTPENSTQTKP